MQGHRPSTACPPGDAVQGHLVNPDFHSMDGMLLILQPVICSCSYANSRPCLVTFQQVHYTSPEPTSPPFVPLFPRFQHPFSTCSNATHQPHKTPSYILTGPHLHPHTLNTVRALALSLRDNPHILSHSGRNLRVNGTRIPAR